jgi:hypothetical protein
LTVQPKAHSWAKELKKEPVSVPVSNFEAAIRAGLPVLIPASKRQIVDKEYWMVNDHPYGHDTTILPPISRRIDTDIQVQNPNPEQRGPIWAEPAISLPVLHTHHDIQPLGRGKNENFFTPSLKISTSTRFLSDSSHLNNLLYVSPTIRHLFCSNPCFISCHYQSRLSTSMKRF